jgi:SAM-dependent methyltransferase
MIGKIKNAARRIARAFGLAPESSVGATAARFWDQEVQRRSVYWTEHPLVRAYVNETITGVSWIWPTVALKAGWAYRPLRRGISIGCGSGNLERNLRILNICTEVTGVDISKESIRQARRAAREEGLKGIKYRVEDCNRLSLPRERYDGVFFHGSLHHISDPDELLTKVHHALKPHGLVYIDDYVGPSRDEWTDEHLRDARALWETIPPELRVVPVNPPLDHRDPSEMIRSSRILPAFRERFEVLHDRPYWGNLLFPLLCALDGEALLRPEHQPLIERLVAAERELVTQQRFGTPLFAVLLGRKKP